MIQSVSQTLRSEVLSQLKNLPKLAVSAALIGGGAASVLGAGSAQAQQWFTYDPVTPPNPPELTVGDKTFTFRSFQDNGTCSATGTFICTVSVTGSGTGPYQVDIDAANPTDGSFVPGPFQGSFEYEVAINPAINPVATFARASLDANFDQVTQNSFFTKELRANNSSGVILDTLAVNSSNNWGPDNTTAIAGQTRLYVRDVWNLASGDRFDNVINGYTQSEVPGPLPILGLGTAFGFSRKLRRRIQKGASSLT